MTSSWLPQWSHTRQTASSPAVSRNRRSHTTRHTRAVWPYITWLLATSSSLEGGRKNSPPSMIKGIVVRKEGYTCTKDPQLAPFSSFCEVSTVQTRMSGVECQNFTPASPSHIFITPDYQHLHKPIVYRTRLTSDNDITPRYRKAISMIAKQLFLTNRGKGIVWKVDPTSKLHWHPF